MALIHIPDDKFKVLLCRLREIKPYEKVSDVIEELMDMLGVYGAHSEACDPEIWSRECRCCLVAHYTERIRSAIELDGAIQEVEKCDR